MPGDVLMLMGDPDQIKAAIKYLYEKAKQPPAASIPREGVPKTISFQIPQGSLLLGKTLREIKLRRNTGVTVLGIQKEGLSISNPGADTNLEEGDTLVLFGWTDQLERALEYLKGK
jgi:K+/H+ antiporter YhaU regulatory subunit KhtT